MIIEALMTSLYNVFSIMTAFINLPKLPGDVKEFFADGINIIVQGAAFIGQWVNLDYFLTLFFMIIAIDIAISGYHFVMWIIRKLPIGSE